ncbi:MAG: ABC transporter permease [Candidatus Bipolaricaulota bacterium]|nr:ABC transporter permease [Candidatus Bipolaricaulota bacterium]MBS3791071.1 ABC transporter permease [Candidatus Bipolaricaulota bacterium]
MLFDYLSLSWHSIRNRSLRSWLTILGVVIGVTAIVTLISIGQGIQDSILNEFDKVGYNTVTVLPGNFDTGRGGFGNTGADTSSYLNKSVINEVEGVKTSAAIRSEDLQIVSEGLEGQAFLRVTGMSPAVLSDFEAYFDGFPISQGERFSYESEESGVVIGDEIARELGVSPGDIIRIEGKEFTVSGLLGTDEEGNDGQFNFYGDLNNGLFIPLSALENLYGRKGNASLILAKVFEDAEVSEVADEIERAYSADDTAATTITTEEISNRVNSALGTIQIALAGIAAISLLVGGIGVMNTMYTAVLERTREIGVMKAVGAKNGQILGLFLTESGLLGLVGGAIGTLVGVGLSILAGRFISQALSAPFTPSFGPGLLIGAIAFSFVLGSISGVLPARQASRLQPVEALRYE